MFLLNASAAAILALIWFATVTYLRVKRKESLVYLMFFTVFFVYLAGILYYTLFQFQSLIIAKYFMPGLMLKGADAEQSINLIPLLSLNAGDVRTSLLNILLMVPLGFGLPFISNLRMGGVVSAGVGLSLSIEFLQFVTGLIGGITFRVADINDVIFNTLGAVAGYALFLGFMRIYGRVASRGAISANPIARYIAERGRGSGSRTPRPPLNSG